MPPGGSKNHQKTTLGATGGARGLPGGPGGTRLAEKWPEKHQNDPKTRWNNASISSFWVKKIRDGFRRQSTKKTAWNQGGYPYRRKRYATTLPTAAVWAKPTWIYTIMPPHSKTLKQCTTIQ